MKNAIENTAKKEAGEPPASWLTKAFKKSAAARARFAFAAGGAGTGFFVFFHFRAA
jgi:hypothetical protein